ncbi:winged helix-turn-helix transcriptional regulator [Paenibacillus sp. MWE-103]|uniref:Winged helix-turn-helix transcriptional regulator n=1 Tax=Paenibacillus artemisiicola TaxID=1172618 RepID=A0ABS3WG69_9BACL|nr:metalloregulator ArsR/SmtB family transcription factor [Paenibacillus artemisiicola]MBO7747292.1 winged helix-turn-helix transcriptional regulator [Paenibacillus artemisiicola]
MEDLITAEAKDKECCDVTIIHDDVVAEAAKIQLGHDMVQRMANFYQALGDPTRLRIVHTLIHAEMCVCDLAAVLEMTQSSISHQLRYLKNLALIKRRKVGRQVYYSIDDEHVLTLFETGLAHAAHQA